MSQNFLQLNEAKSEILLFGPPNAISSTQSNGGLSANVKSAASNLWVIFDPNLSFNGQMTSIVQSCFFQLRNIAKIRSFVSCSDLEKVIFYLLTFRLLLLL